MVGIYNSLACIVIVHVIFGLPMMTLLFRNYYAGLPIELFKAARVDGGGFWTIFLRRDAADVDADRSSSPRSCRSPASGTTSSSA